MFWLPVAVCRLQAGLVKHSALEAVSLDLRCTAEKKDGYYVLNGSKMWITNGPIASEASGQGGLAQPSSTLLRWDIRVFGWV